MIDVDVSSVWKQGRTEFTHWFTAASLLGNLLFVRGSTRFSVSKSIAADLAMTAASWLFVAALPVSLYAYAIVKILLFADHLDPVSWIIPALFSALTGALSGIVILRVFGQKVRRLAVCILAALNFVYVGLAIYRMVAYVLAHPPEA